MGFCHFIFLLIEKELSQNNFYIIFLIHLENCSIKVLNALDFLHALNDKGGVNRGDNTSA